MCSQGRLHAERFSKKLNGMSEDQLKAECDAKKHKDGRSIINEQEYSRINDPNERIDKMKELLAAEEGGLPGTVVVFPTSKHTADGYRDPESAFLNTGHYAIG